MSPLSKISLAFLATTHLLGLVVGAARFEAFDRSRLDNSSFFEQFDYNSLEESGWIPSSHSSSDGRSYSGIWSIEEATVYGGLAGDKALVMKSRSSKYAISHQFKSPLKFDNDDLVIQYEVKFQNGISCGGAYIKLFDVGFEQSELSDMTPFQIMFGPDLCGTTNKVHFIVKKENPKSGITEEKHFRRSPMARTGQLTSLYTLIFKRNYDYEIRIDGETVKKGNALEDTNPFVPPLYPPEFIPDLNDEKPKDWLDEPTMQDPSYPKPENYDEKYNTYWIPDPNAIKPAEWNEDEPLKIFNNTCTKPIYWDDNEDGTWVPPLIYNPKCKTGCGKWHPPLIVNPDYRGPWKYKYIINPEYKGLWKPRLIPNPDYYEISSAPLLSPIGGVGFELWVVESGILFDNIYVGHSVSEAEVIGNETFGRKFMLENELFNNHFEPDKDHNDIDNLKEELNFSLLNDVCEGIKVVWALQVEELSNYYNSFLNDPLNTLTQDPFKFFVYCCALLAVFTFIFGIMCVILLAGSQNIPVQHEVQSEHEKEQAQQLDIEDVNNSKSTSAQFHSFKSTKRNRREK